MQHRERLTSLFGHVLVCASQALAISPNDADLYASRAQSYIKEERFLEAVQDASKAAELSPELAKAHVRKGYVYYHS